MKKMTTKLLTATIALTIIIFLTSAFNKAQTNGNKYLVMRAWEAAGGGSSKIMIVYEDGKTEEQDLDKFRPDNLLPNTIKIAQAINNISGKGYELTMISTDQLISTYIFTKK